MTGLIASRWWACVASMVAATLLGACGLPGGDDGRRQFTPSWVAALPDGGGTSLIWLGPLSARAERVELRQVRGETSVTIVASVSEGPVVPTEGFYCTRFRLGRAVAGGRLVSGVRPSPYHRTNQLVRFRTRQVARGVRAGTVRCGMVPVKER